MSHRPLLVLAIVLAACTSLPAQAQWKWRDKSGVVQYSDRPPPRDVAAKDILERPAAPVETRVAARPSTPASAPPAAPGASTPAGVDPELQARRRKVEEDAKAKARADQDKAAAVRAEDCQRARAHMRTLTDGGRLARTDAKGERVILDDQARAEEVARAREVISRVCE